MTVKPKEEGPVEKAVIQSIMKTEVLIDEVRSLRTDIAHLPKSNLPIFLFVAVNFVINCAVLIVLYANLHP